MNVLVIAEKSPIKQQRALYLLHPYTTMLISSLGEDNSPNIMAVAWIIPVSVKPPLLVMSIRPERYSYELIETSKEFIVNIPDYQLVKKVLFCGRRTGRKHNKFSELGLTPDAAQIVKAPIIKECIGHLECKVKEILKRGDHNLIFGEIVTAYVTKGYFTDYYDLDKFQPCLHLGKNVFTTCINDITEPEL
ncbi:MAG: flavin reductase family protein [Candidatus Heimdallarchaeota archaeon]|nr:flavin reductase family protein [Candidatus Heimdallarchaeota archaeon]